MGDVKEVGEEKWFMVDDEIGDICGEAGMFKGCKRKSGILVY